MSSADDEYNVQSFGASNCESLHIISAKHWAAHSSTEVAVPSAIVCIASNCRVVVK